LYECLLRSKYKFVWQRLLKGISSIGERLGFKKAMVVTDKFLNQTGVAGKVLAELDSINLEYIVYDDVKPNPTIENVYAGVDVFKTNECDVLVL
jgi:alcohol dehydrogenase